MRGINIRVVSPTSGSLDEDTEGVKEVGGFGHSYSSFRMHKFFLLPFRTKNCSENRKQEQSLGPSPAHISMMGAQPIFL